MMHDAKAGPATRPSADIAYWKQRLHELPDIRIEKVQRTRALLETGSYDTENILDVTVERIRDEISVRLRNHS